ncbi:hypothetical protein OG205_29115 [Lentzea sp. NBC_00516]|uniref:hypothetical protein n=1 Tax=Lentzea sp. NBC_00516 TaxID=2903582 RepID=UPI002E823FCC|nr:hypothetical protein [Lentzea sp. NBC_00516]WUD22144.1 hypothetical protein OG205_29115 [Lentzea sp. NBC_00516]
MNPWVSFAASILVAILTSSVAIWIAISNWTKQQKRDDEDRVQAQHKELATQVAELLRLYLATGCQIIEGQEAARSKAILLTLPGHLATLLRAAYDLQHTMRGVPLDPATAGRMKPEDPQDAGGKWKLFDRNSIQQQRALRRKQPYREWVEAELAYDIAGLRGGDQDAVLKALSMDMRDPKSAAIGLLEQTNSSGA